MTSAKKLTASLALTFLTFLTFLPLLTFAVLLGAAPARAGEPATATKTPPAETADASKAVTLKGTLGCGKCSFHEAKACENVLKVKRADASGKGEIEETYLLADNDVSRANHEKVCGPASPATVTGTISEPKRTSKKKPARKILTASSIAFE